MFLEYYNLAEQPFGVTPDPRFLYLNRMYREALASLWYGVKEGRGFMALVAQPGMGKTTLLFQLLQRLRTESARTVFLFQTCCSSLDLIRYLLQDMGILPASDLASMHQQLNDALVREARAGKQFVFVIDEAQNLSPAVLETVRLLSDFETPQGKLLQIILAGQPQLLSTLTRPGMLQLRQRISVTTALDPLVSTAQLNWAAEAISSQAPEADDYRWYAVQTRVRFEKKVAAQLERKGIETFLPLMRQVHRWSDRRQVVEIPLFPGYVFVELYLAPATRLPVVQTAGVVQFVSFNGEAVPIPRKQIDGIQQVLSKEVPCAMYPFLKTGQKVRIRGGCLDGLEGILADRSSDKTLLISVEAIERTIAIHLEGYDIELV